MNAWMLALAAVSAAGSVITSLPVVISWAQSGSRDVAASRATRKWGRVTLFGVAALIFSGVGLYRTFTAPPVITAENAEQMVRTWSDDLGLSVQKIKASDVYFRLDVTPANGLGIAITRPKERDRYLVFGSETHFQPSVKSQLSNLPKEQFSNLRSELVLDLARTNVLFEVQLPDAIKITHQVPITSNLTEDEFARAITVVNDANLVAKASMLLNAGRLGVTFPP